MRLILRDGVINVVERKLVRSGSSIVVTIPPEWLKENKLKGNDSIEMRVEQNKLIIKKIENAP